jgi:hypothetical protein
MNMVFSVDIYNNQLMIKHRGVFLLEMANYDLSEKQKFLLEGIKMEATVKLYI